MKTNALAWELRSKLFDLVNQFKDLQLAASNNDAWDADKQVEASGQLDAVACRLATVYEELPDIFTDAVRDTKDQYFA